MLIEAFVDGACRQQGQNGIGEASCAVIIYKNRKEVVRYARGLGKRTNNEAEYEAVLTALLICSMSEFHNPIIYSDSLLVVNHILEKWNCTVDSLLPLLMSIKEIQAAFNFKIQHVPRDNVQEADFLAKKFLDQLQQKQIEYKTKGQTNGN